MDADTTGEGAAVGAAVGIDVLGTAVAVVDGVRHELGAARQRALLTVLAMHAGQSVSTGSIIAALWGDAPPSGVASTLQGYVADLRRVLEPRRAPREPARVLVTVPDGYALQVPPEAVDLTRFEAALEQAALDLRVVPDLMRPHVSPLDSPAVARAAHRLEAALAEWRGEPFSDLGGDLEVECERDRLRALRLEAEILRHTAHLALGGHTTSVADLERLARAHPWNERLWGLWAVALTRSGRQAQALACLRRLRTCLADELGIDPGPEVRDLETAIIRQDLPAPCPADRGVPAGFWPLVGRRHELGHLLRALDLADRGTPRSVHLTGEYGIGKTRLTRELEQYAAQRGFRVVRTTCPPTASGVDLWAWDRLLTGLEDAAGAPRRTEALGPAGSCELLLHLGDRAIELLQSAAERSPLMIVLEDAQRADEATLGVMTHLVEALDAGRVLLVVTERTPGRRSSAMTGLLHSFGRAHALDLELTGLDTDEVAALVSTVAGVHLHPRLAADTARRTDGNPFLVIELARSGDFAATSLPATVHDVVTHHLAGVGAPVRDLLGAASLLDRTFDADLLARAADRDVTALFEELSPAVAAGILREEPGDRYAFRQAIVREVLAADLSRNTRTRWDARFASTGQDPLRSA